MNLICFSHLRWNFVYQRPQHLMSRFAKLFTTYYVEQYIYNDEQDGYSTTTTPEAVTIVHLHLNGQPGNKEEDDERCKKVLQNFFHDQYILITSFWYYTPMAMPFTQSFRPGLVVYDCMDELTAFKFAPPSLKKMEEQLFAKADIVFTGGQSLFEAKRHLHHNIYPFPSSIDKAHFGAARYSALEPADQQNIRHPWLGFFGVKDERFDIDLIKNAADLRPDWHLCL